MADKVRPADFRDVFNLGEVLRNFYGKDKITEKDARSASSRMIKASVQGATKKHNLLGVSEEDGIIDGLVFAQEVFALDLARNVRYWQVNYLCGRNRARELLRWLKRGTRGRPLVLLGHERWGTIEAYGRLLRPLGAKQVGGIWRL